MRHLTRKQHWVLFIFWAVMWGLWIIGVVPDGTAILHSID
jgi:hypothetical protein